MKLLEKIDKRNLFFNLSLFLTLLFSLLVVNITTHRVKNSEKMERGEAEAISFSQASSTSGDFMSFGRGYPKIFMPSGGMILPNQFFPNFFSEAINYDLIIVSFDSLINRDTYNSLTQLKRTNPNLIVLLYIAAQEVREWSLASLYGQVYEKAQTEGWLRENISTCSCYRGTKCVDISTGWKSYLPAKINEWIGQKDTNRVVNGVYYDNVYTQPHCFPRQVSVWQEAMKNILRETRGFVGGNGIFYPSDSPYLGFMDFSSREDWPGVSTPWGWRNNWNNGMRVIYGWVLGGGYFGLAYNPEGKSGRDYQAMRFGLTTSLLADRVFYHYWPGIREGIFYDEYAVNLITGEATSSYQDKGYLGRALGEAYDPLTGETLNAVYTRNLTTDTDNTDADLSRHVWVREYQNGVVIVNPTSFSKTISKNRLPAGGNLRRIRGTQDSTVNNGSIIGETITIPPADGIILLKREVSGDGGQCPNGERGNLDCDLQGLINEVDLNILLFSWHTNSSIPLPPPSPGQRSADIAGNDGLVNERDLLVLMSNFSRI